MKKINVGSLVFAVLLPLLIGMASAALASRGMAVYGSMSKPPLSPPAWAFSAAWTILYLLMGLASYYIIVADQESGKKKMALLFYAIQLAMNFMWSVIFFNWNMYLVAFFWLIVMWGVVIICAICFYHIKKLAGFLMIPYILWMGFAAYLNLGAYMINTTGNGF